MNGNKRGSIVYKGVFYDRGASMYLERRYKVCVVYTTDDRTTEEIYFGNDEEKLFVAGYVNRPNNLGFEERREKYNECVRFQAIAEDYGNKNYPDWKNVAAYWDGDKELSRGLVK